VLALVLGNALAFAWAETVPAIYALHLLLAAGFNLAGQAILAALMIRRAAVAVTVLALAVGGALAETAATVRNLLRLRIDRRIGEAALLDHLSFVFLWAAAVMQLLLVFDPRYRDFPLPAFAVPLVCVIARTMLGERPSGGGREELWAGGTLAVAALASVVLEGAGNLQSLAWNATALVLAAPALLSLRPAPRPRRAA
jgi:hypothetical protein